MRSLEAKTFKSGWMIFEADRHPSDDEVEQWVLENPGYTINQKKSLDQLVKDIDYLEFTNENMCNSLSFILFKKEKDALDYSDHVPLIQVGAEDIQQVFYCDLEEFFPHFWEDDFLIEHMKEIGLEHEVIFLDGSNLAVDFKEGKDLLAKIVSDLQKFEALKVES